MIKIAAHTNKIASIFYSIQENPSSGTFGDYLLYKEFLKKLEWEEEPSYGTKIHQRDQAKFNMRFLVETLGEYGQLHCVYCGREDLVIFPFHNKPKDIPKGRMATCDHILPRSLYPHLALIKGNCTVACSKCNRKKNLSFWEEKFPYN